MKSKNISAFNPHPDLEGQHSFLSASQYHWVNYSDERLIHTFKTRQAALLGTRLHNFAKDAILLGIKLPNSKKTLNAFINDAIGFRMTPEVLLYFSDFAFGTADAISFRERTLRIHDLKTGTSPVSKIQVYLYAALFCLEYTIEPKDIEFELRIYQNDEIQYYKPEHIEISALMDKYIYNDRLLRERGLE